MLCNSCTIFEWAAQQYQKSKLAYLGHAAVGLTVLPSGGRVAESDREWLCPGEALRKLVTRAMGKDKNRPGMHRAVVLLPGVEVGLLLGQGGDSSQKLAAGANVFVRESSGESSVLVCTHTASFGSTTGR